MSLTRQNSQGQLFVLRSLECPPDWNIIEHDSSPFLNSSLAPVVVVIVVVGGGGGPTNDTRDEQHNEDHVPPGCSTGRRGILSRGTLPIRFECVGGLWPARDVWHPRTLCAKLMGPEEACERGRQTAKQMSAIPGLFVGLYPGFLARAVAH